MHSTGLVLLGQRGLRLSRGQSSVQEDLRDSPSAEIRHNALGLYNTGAVHPCGHEKKYVLIANLAVRCVAKLASRRSFSAASPTTIERVGLLDRRRKCHAQDGFVARAYLGISQILAIERVLQKRQDDIE